MASGTSAMQCGEFINYVAPRRPQVIDPKPGFKRVVNNFSRTDYQKIGLCAVVSLPFGYFAGALRTPPRFDCSPLCLIPPHHSWMFDTQAYAPQALRDCRKCGCRQCTWLALLVLSVAFAWRIRCRLLLLHCWWFKHVCRHQLVFCGEDRDYCVDVSVREHMKCK